MASESNSPTAEASGEDAEIFDRLFELDEEDVSWIKRHIGDHMEACKRYLGETPPLWREALREAKEASVIAFSEGMANIESKINFYMAHCYRGLGMWDKAHKFYMASTVDAQDIYWLQRLQVLSRQKMEGERDPELRRVRGSGDLHSAYNYVASLSKAMGSRTPLTKCHRLYPFRVQERVEL
ncbi:hypothetical protein Trco_006527 [Trichoderma cornu-damae]|uniref:Uncharacterized protein n=1 Tax=Trichoderma cornu-damae TaxID=654480 RepID=A0A9P8QFB8_9HYPO|nr:hypothetical protein Trco_006527 [Trichoderma cornu-damae]